MIRFLFLLLILFSSCQKSALSPSQRLHINIGTDPQTLDPLKARDLTCVTMVHMLFEGLTRTSRSGDLEMALAHDVEISENGTQYVFHLRKSFWSNGDPVTSFDFAAAWKKILDPHFPTDIAYQLYIIKNGRKVKLGEIGPEQIGVQTPDSQTLVVELEQQTPYFLQLVSLTPFFPIPHKVLSANVNWALQADTYVCNGPFLLQSWKHSDQIQLIKNPTYWESKQVKIEGIDLLMVAGDTEMRMFEEGKLDWAGSPLSAIPVDAVADLRQRDLLHISPLSGTYFFRTNTSEQVRGKKNPLCSPSFRKALSFAINRSDIAEHILQGGQIPAKSLVPPEMGLSQTGYFTDNNIDMAQSLLVDALLELDLALDTLQPITVSFYNNDRNTAIAQAIQKQWEKNLGIQVELEAVEPKTFFHRISQKEFQLAAGSWTADFNDPINFLEVFKFKDASTNNTNWESIKYLDLLNRSGLCKDLEERKWLMREAEQILMEQMPIIPVFHFALNYLQSGALEEVAVSPLGQLDFRWAKFELSELRPR
ncbi:MAG: peptide ABC transporter substrate-binding protein [Chlamydiota bacterium]